MESSREISALFHLIDDPDEEVYHSVSDKILSFGKAIIPNLEALWESSPNEAVQERIETIIHRLHYRDLTQDFIQWKEGDMNLLQGALLVCRYHYPDMALEPVMQEMEKLRRNTWLELNNYLTSLEQANILTGIIYNYFKLKGTELAYTHPDDFLVNKVLEGKKGNVVSNGIIYLTLCELLDIPVKCVNIPRQFILGYMDTRLESIKPTADPSEKIKFFIDPVNGQVYSHQDVENYFKRIQVPPTAGYYRTRANKQVIQHLLEELAKCFDNDLNQYKMQELLALAAILAE